MKRKRRRAAATAEAAEAEAAPQLRPRKRKRKRAAAAAAAEAPAEEEAEEEEEGEQVDEEDEGCEADNAAGNEVDMDMEWEFRDPDESDFHAVKDLLRTPGTWQFVGETFNYSELADSVVGQGNIGTIIKSSGVGAEDDDETSCGLLTALNLRQFSHLSWPKAIETALLAKAVQHAQPQVSKDLKDLLGRKGKGTEVGVLLSERFTNLPEDLIPPLHKALKEDIEWSCTTDECPKEERPFYFFTHLIGVAKCYMSSGAAAAAGLTVAGTGPFFQLDEVQAYVKKASWSFSFPARDKDVKAREELVGKRKKSGGGPPAPDGRTVFMITRKALDQVVKELSKSSA